MVVVIAVEEFHVQIHAGIFAKALEEMLEHAGFDSACSCSRELYVPNKTDAVAKVNSNAA